MTFFTKLQNFRKYYQNFYFLFSKNFEKTVNFECIFRKFSNRSNADFTTSLWFFYLKTVCRWARKAGGSCRSPHCLYDGCLGRVGGAASGGPLNGWGRPQLRGQQSLPGPGGCGAAAPAVLRRQRSADPRRPLATVLRGRLLSGAERLLVSWLR